MQHVFPVKRVELDDITAGTSLALCVRLRDFASPVWTLSVALRGPATIDLDGVASADGGWTLSAAATVTTAWTAGRYWYSARVTDGTDVFEVGLGEISILPNLDAVSATYDGRSQNEIALDAIDAVLANRATRDQEQYKINSRELKRTPIKDLLSLRAYYATQVRRERARKAGRSRFGRAVRVEFGPI